MTKCIVKGCKHYAENDIRTAVGSSTYSVCSEHFDIVWEMCEVAEDTVRSIAKKLAREIRRLEMGDEEKQGEP